jgi:ribosomal protein L21E
MKDNALYVEVVGKPQSIFHGRIGKVLNVELEDSETYVNVYFEEEKVRMYFQPEDLEVVQ